MHIVLLRHGATANNANNITQTYAKDVPLLDSAYADLQTNLPSIAAAFNSLHITNILCSDMLRAKQTADYVRLYLNLSKLQIQYMYELREVNFGDFGGTHDSTIIDGKTMQTYRSYTKQMYADGVSKFSYPNGETSDSIRLRCQSIIAKLASLAANNARGVCIIGHNRLFRHLLVELGRWQSDNMFNDKLPHSQAFYVGNVSEIDLNSILCKITRQLYVQQ